MSACHDLLDFLLHLITLVVTASAAFGGAFGIVWLQGRKEAQERVARYEALLAAIGQEAEVHGRVLQRLDTAIPGFLKELKDAKQEVSLPLQSFDTGSLESLRDDLVFCDPRSPVGIPLRQAIRDLVALQMYVEMYRQSYLLQPDGREGLIRGIKGLEANIDTVKSSLTTLKAACETRAE